MKTIYLSFLLIIMFTCSHFLSYSQQANQRSINPERPIFLLPKSHDPNFLKAAKFPDKSFYQRKSEWKHIIDTTWGPGAPLDEKLKIFNTFTKAIHDKFDGFQSLKLNWDSLYNHYLNQINDSTSKGKFSAIMSHFAYNLLDTHTYAFDTTVINTPLNPDIPILVIGTYFTVEHFGAVTTVLPDSTTLILRVAPHHPLNLEPGDIILGYEGVLWKNLFKELMEAELPILGITGGCKSAVSQQNLSGAGLNWHLFSTIDILKYSSGDTLHLSLKPMIGFKIPRMVNNPQLPIPNIPFPHVVPYPEVSDTVVTFGKLENTNIGYIFLSGHWSNTVDDQFYRAINSLKNTDALIIDMRLSYGGWALFDKAFNRLFNEFHKTIEDAYRCDTNTFELCPLGNWADFQINGKDTDYYDRPIAVLSGPYAISMGDLTLHRLRYHPMVRSFGLSSSGNMGYNEAIKSFPGWDINYSMGDMFHVSNPGNYLNKKEFPIDFPVWFNKNDVAKGIDPIVEKAKEWINTLAYGHSLTLNKSSFTGEDTIKVTAIIENPENHELFVKLIIESIDSINTDSVEMIPLNEGKGWQVTYDVDDLAENFYWLSVKVEDKTTGTFFTNKHMTRFTTVPLIIDSLAVKKTADYKYTIQPYLKNKGNTVIIQQPISVTLSTNSWVKTISPTIAYSPVLEPGQVNKVEVFNLTCDTATFQSHFDLKFTIASQGWPYWTLDTTIAVIPTSIQKELLLPLTNLLNQNYPNPFNSETSISWQLAKGNRVTLSVFNILGTKVATLIDDYRPEGKYETKLNAATLPKGIYFYQLKAGKFIQTRKMIVVK